MAVRAYAANSGDVVVTDEGALVSILGGAHTFVVVFKRTGSTFDGTQMLLSLHASVDGSQRGAISISSAGAMQFTIGGLSRTFGFTIANDVWYAFVVKRATGAGQTVRANLYNFSTASWAGWANGSDTLDDGATDLIEIRHGAGPGGFGLAGNLAMAAAYSSVLADATAETLSTSAQTAFDLSPMGMWRYGMGTPVADDTAGGADQTSISGTTIDNADDPFNLDLGGGAEVTLTPVTLTLTAQPLTPMPGMVAVALTPAALQLAGQPVTPVPGPVAIDLAPATLTLAAMPLSPVPGPVAVALVPAVLMSTAVPIVFAPLVPLTPDVMVHLAQPARAVDLGVPVVDVDLTVPVQTVAL